MAKTRVISIRVDETTYRMWIEVLKKEGVEPGKIKKSRQDKKVRDVFRRMIEIYKIFG